MFERNLNKLKITNDSFSCSQTKIVGFERDLIEATDKKLLCSRSLCPSIQSQQMNFWLQTKLENESFVIYMKEDFLCLSVGYNKTGRNR